MSAIIDDVKNWLSAVIGLGCGASTGRCSRSGRPGQRTVVTPDLDCPAMIGDHAGQGPASRREAVKGCRGRDAMSRIDEAFAAEGTCGFVHHQVASWSSRVLQSGAVHDDAHMRVRV